MVSNTVHFRARMDLQLIPLHIILDVIVKIEVDLLFGTITKVIYKATLWTYTSPTINMNIFNLNNAEPDESPPAFDWYSRAVSFAKTCYFVNSFSISQIDIIILIEY